MSEVLRYPGSAPDGQSRHLGSVVSPDLHEQVVVVLPVHCDRATNTPDDPKRTALVAADGTLVDLENDDLDSHETELLEGVVEDETGGLGTEAP